MGLTRQAGSARGAQRTISCFDVAVPAPNTRSCRWSRMRGALARDDDGSVICCCSKSAYVARVTGKDAVAGRGQENNGRVDRV